MARVLTMRSSSGLYVPATVPPPGGGDLVFSEDFLILGSDNNARTQGGVWTTAGTAHDIVSGAASGADQIPGYSGGAMRFNMSNAEWGQMHKLNMVPASTEHWISYYTKGDHGTRSDHGTGHNIGRVGSDQFQILADVVYGRLNGTDLSAWNPGDPWMAGISVPGPVAGSNYPYNRMYTGALAGGANWYRRANRFVFHPSDPTLYRVFPYVFGADGVTLLKGPGDFNNAGETGTTTSLLQWYDIGGADRWSLIGDTDPQPESARHWGIGTEGPSDGSGWEPSTPHYRYIAKIRVSLTGDPGA